MSARVRRRGPSRRDWWRRNGVSLVLLVPVLLGFAWTLGQTAREGWWVSEPHRAVTPGTDGWASIDGTDLRIAELVRLDELVPEVGDPWTPPPGYALWHLVVDLRSSLTEARTCEVRLVDTEGRVFSSPGGVPLIPGHYGQQSIACGFVDPDTALELGPQNELPFLLPEQAEPSEVRVYSVWSGDLALGPDYFALPAP